MKELDVVCFNQFELQVMPSDPTGHRLGTILPKEYDPEKHRVVMIDITIGECILYPDKETGVYYNAKEDKPAKSVTRKYEQEYKLYCEYTDKLTTCHPTDYEAWEKEWKGYDPIRQKGTLQKYAEMLGYSVKPLASLQESSEAGSAFCFAIDVTSKG